MTPTDQIARFEWMLAVCESRGWHHLADLIFEQYIKLANEIAEKENNNGH